MRRYLAISVAFAFLVFMAAAMAQAGSSGGGQAGGGQAGGGQAGSGQAGAPGGTGTMGSQSDQTTSGTPAGTQDQGMGKSASAGKSKTVEGCIVKEDTDYFLIPKSGDPIMLQAGGSENPSAHEGHRVKVKGNEQSVSSSGGAGTSGGAAGTASSSGAAGAAGAQSGQSGAVGSQTQPASGSSASAGGQLHSSANKEISVDKITMVSETCPATWNSKYSSGAGKSGPGGSQGSSQTPPPNF